MRRPSIVTYLKNLLALDARSLALLRVGISLSVLLSMLERLPDFRLLFTDEGCAPRRWLFEEFFSVSGFSLYTVSGNEWVLLPLYLFHMACALAVIAGWNTRRFTIALWFLTTSLCNRNPNILDGGDEVCRIVLFWGMFLPWGRVWSWDARHQEEAPLKVVSPWTVAFLVQVSVMYAFTGWTKFGQEWSDGSAAQLFLAQKTMVRPWTAVLSSYPELTSWLAVATKWIELLAPLLIFFPLWPVLGRLLAAFLLSSFHLAMLAIADFPILSLAFLAFSLSLLPSFFWERGREDILCEVKYSVWSISTASFLMILVLSWNLFVSSYILEFPQRYLLPRPMKLTVTALGLNQFWAFFAPYPPRVYGWVVAEAQLADGSAVDLITEGEALWERPKDLHRHFANHSWRMLTRACVTIESFQDPFLQGLVNRWNHRHPENPVQRVELYHVQYRILLDLRELGPSTQLLVQWP